MSDGNIAPQYDPSDFSVEPYVKRIEKPWGYELHLAPESAPYMMKIIHVNEGAKLSLQIHDTKQESWTLMRGKAMALLENNKGELVNVEMPEGAGLGTHIGQKHRLVGITDTDILEVSTPENGTTWRLEDDYERPHETEEQRRIDRAD